MLNVDDLDIDHAAIHVANYAEQAQSDLNATSGLARGPLAPGDPPGAAHDRASRFTTRTARPRSGFASRTTRIGSTRARSSARTSSAECGSTSERSTTAADGTPVHGGWASLCARQATFAFGGGYPDFTIADEGYVKSSAMSAPPASATPVYNVNEALFHWDGWSLVASRPGGSVGTSGVATTTADGGLAPLPTDGPVFPTNTGSRARPPVHDHNRRRRPARSRSSASARTTSSVSGRWTSPATTWSSPPRRTTRAPTPRRARRSRATSRSHRRTSSFAARSRKGRASSVS